MINFLFFWCYELNESVIVEMFLFEFGLSVILVYVDFVVE